jgi:hypothetical protein
MPFHDQPIVIIQLDWVPPVPYCCNQPMPVVVRSSSDLLQGHAAHGQEGAGQAKAEPTGGYSFNEQLPYYAAQDALTGNAAASLDTARAQSEAFKGQAENEITSGKASQDAKEGIAARDNQEQKQIRG